MKYEIDVATQSEVRKGLCSALRTSVSLIERQMESLYTPGLPRTVIDLVEANLQRDIETHDRMVLEYKRLPEFMRPWDDLLMPIDTQEICRKILERKAEQ